MSPTKGKPFKKSETTDCPSGTSRVRTTCCNRAIWTPLGEAAFRTWRTCSSAPDTNRSVSLRRRLDSDRIQDKFFALWRAKQDSEALDTIQLTTRTSVLGPKSCVNSGNSDSAHLTCSRMTGSFTSDEVAFGRTGNPLNGHAAFAVSGPGLSSAHPRTS